MKVFFIDVGMTHCYNRTLNRLNSLPGVEAPAIPVARADRIRSILGWEPRFADLRTIVEDAWRWERKLAGK